MFRSECTEAILMWDGIFTCNMENMHALCWRQHLIAYLQIVREWNECIGFADVNGGASTINELPDLIADLRLIETRAKHGTVRIPGAAIDLANLISFLEECLQFGINVSIMEL